MLFAVRLALLAAFASPAAHAKTALASHRGSLRANVDVRAFVSELGEAMDEAMGCGGRVGPERLAVIKGALLPVWRALPKIAHQRVERQSLRYLVHRYFNKKAALLVRGFEPTRSNSASGWSSADVLSQRVPRYIESVLESRHAQEHGFDLKDAVQVVAMMEQVIYDSESTLLEKAYQQQRRPTSQSLDAAALGDLLDVYLVRWMMGEDVEGAAALLANRTFLASAFPHWSKLSDFVRGEIKTVDFRRVQMPRDVGHAGHNALVPRFSFDDVHNIVADITGSFASFWESECATMKATLMGMDTQGTGRVPLSRFYSSALDSEWRFGESETYLRELGVLDESSSWRGKQVVIPNYMQAASNCIVSTPHYLVCCINECDTLRGELEESLQASSAPPSAILALVKNMTSQTTVDHDDPPVIRGAQMQQLEQIAEVHGGQVPLHGRLFAQWLHYAFPRECAFPHRRGATLAVTPGEFGSTYLATDEEMERHAASFDAAAELEPQNATWMSQWSPEEELLSELFEAQATWSPGRLALGSVAFLVLAAAGIISLGKTAGGATLLPTHQKSHFV